MIYIYCKSTKMSSSYGLKGNLLYHSCFFDAAESEDETHQAAAPACSNSRSSCVACSSTACFRSDWALVRRHASAGERIPAGSRRRVVRSCAAMDGVASSRHWPVLRLCSKPCDMADEQGDRLRSPHPLLHAFIAAYSSALCFLRQSSEQNRESARLAMKAL